MAMPTVRSTEEVLQLLRDALPDLRKRYPIARIGIFGSYARGEQTPASDVDVLVEFESDTSSGGLTIIDVWDELQKILGTRVDIVEPSNLKLMWARAILPTVQYVI